MGMVAGNTQEKSQIAKEICELSTRASACADLHHPRTNKSPFINWYLVLKVDENADTGSIRKRYHKLALLLHPDKNSHSNAETAFKLVSEAYMCLSDITRRRAFDREKETISCIKCNPNSCRKTDSYAKLQKETSRYMRIKELRHKLREEAIIIDKCLLANAAASRKESPVFDPSEYQHKNNQKRVEDLRAALKIGMYNAIAKNGDYPIFEYRSQRVSSSMARCASSRDGLI